MANKLIGILPNQVPTNADLGSLAYQNKENIQIDNLTTELSTTDRLSVGAVYNLGATPPAASIVYSSTGRTYNINSSTELFVERSTTAYMSIIGNSSSIINFGDSSSETKGKIAYVPTANYMAFYTNETEKLRIDSAGNVGIGTTSPSSKLDVVTAGSVVVGNFETDGNATLTLKRTGTSPSTLSISASTGGVAKFSATTYMGFNTNSVERMRFVPNTGYMHLAYGQNGDAARINFGGTTGFAQISGNGTTTNGDLIFKTITSDSLTEKVRITSSVNVGIGTTGPAYKLDVIGSIASSGRIYLTRTGVNPAYIQMTPSGDNSESVSIHTRYGGYTKDFEIFRRNTLVYGNLGIGTTSPAYELDVSGDARITGNLTVSGNTTFVNTNDLVIEDLNITLANGAADAASANGAGFTIDGANATFTYDNSDTSFKVNQNFYPDSDATYDLGSPTVRWNNIYTTDLHLSNENKEGGNDVDGTTGNWTLQEGADAIYMINNRTGKKYKIALEEVE